MTQKKPNFETRAVYITQKIRDLMKMITDLHY